MIDIGHTRSCATWDGSTDQSGCTCCLQVRIALSTEQTMHAVWRKRAEEAEAERDAVKKAMAMQQCIASAETVSLNAAIKERDAALAENAILSRYRLSLSDALAERDDALVERDDAQFAAHKQRELEVINANIMRALSQSRDEALARVARQSNSIGVMADRAEAAEAEALALREALCMIYDKWEDETSCFDESDNDLGKALRLDKEEEDSILALIPKERREAPEPNPIVDGSKPYYVDIDGVRRKYLPTGETLESDPVAYLITWWNGKKKASLDPCHPDDGTYEPLYLKGVLMSETEAAIKIAEVERDAAMAEAHALREDAKRYRWLTDDRADADMRAQVRLIAGSMAISGKGYTDAAIDAVMEKP